MRNVVFDLKNIEALKESLDVLYPVWEEVAKVRENRGSMTLWELKQNSYQVVSHNVQRFSG